MSQTAPSLALLARLRLGRFGWLAGLSGLITVGCGGAAGHTAPIKTPGGEGPAGQRDATTTSTASPPPKASTVTPKGARATSGPQTVLLPATHPELPPCQRVAAHEVESRRAALRRLRERSQELGLPEPAAAVAALRRSRDEMLEQEFAWRGGRRRLSELSEQERQVAAIADQWGPAGRLQTVQGELARAEQLALQWTQDAPLQLEDPYELSPDFCQEDAQGAWATWTLEARYAPEQELRTQWHLGRRVGVARVRKDGSVLVVDELPGFLEAPAFDPQVAGDGNLNCCTAAYGHGAPQVAFIHDQDGDGVPELGLAATYSVEGSVDRVSAIYSARGDTLSVQTLSFDSARDFDGEGRLDLVVVDVQEVGEACGSGFPVNVSGKEYLGHGLPDGTYSFTDAVAERYAREQCPAPPTELADYTSLWCARLWGASSEELAARLTGHCAPQVCDEEGNPPSSGEPCEWLRAAARGFNPPLRLRPAK